MNSVGGKASAEVAEVLAQARGRRFWRALDELCEEPGFRRQLMDAFPALASGPAEARRRLPTLRAQEARPTLCA